MYPIVETEALSSAAHKLVVSAPAIAKKVLPGQFIMLRIDEEGERIPLTMEFGEVVKEHDYVALLRDRVSNRFYAEDPMTLDQLWLRVNAHHTLRSRRLQQVPLMERNLRGLVEVLVDEGALRYVPEDGMLYLAPKEDV